MLAGYLFLKVGHCFAHKSRLQRTWLLPKFVAADLTLALSFLDFTFGLGKQLVFRISYGLFFAVRTIVGLVFSGWH